MRRYARAVLGGTFDRLHLGHESLLETAFWVGQTVAIGLTTERYLADHPKPDRAALQPYATRRRALTGWLQRHHPHGSWTVVPLNDRFGGSVAPGVGVLVVSVDTVGGGKAVNAERLRRGLPAVPMAVVPLALADDLRPVASRRIRVGTIDRRGHRRSPITVVLRTSHPMDAAPATRAIRSAFPRAIVRTGVGSRPQGPPDRRRSVVRRLPTAELFLDVTGARREAGEWSRELPGVRLLPVRIAGTRPVHLARGLRVVLRPASGRAPGESF